MGFPKVTSLTNSGVAEGGVLRIIKDTSITLNTQEIPRVLVAFFFFGQDWDEDQYIIHVLSHNTTVPM